MTRNKDRQRNPLANPNVQKQERGQLGQVNWERGRLLQHQSFPSFGAMFCELNYISARQFTKYWLTKFGPRRQKEDQRMRHIAYLLHEPLSVVSTVFGNQLKSVEGVPFEAPLDVVSYCPLCIVEGFHGQYHDDSLLMRCPIHGVKLCREHLPIGKTVLEGYVERLRQLFRQQTPNWPQNAITADYSAPQKHPTLAEYCNWGASIRNATCDWNVVELYNSDDGDEYPLLPLDIWLGRMAWCVPVSERVTNLFLVKPSSENPVIHRCNEDIARELASLTEKIDLSMILWTFKATQLLWNVIPFFAPYLQGAIAALRTNHERHQCTCIWGAIGFDPWIRFEKASIRDFYSVLCPHRYAAEELRKNWLAVVPRGRSWQDRFVSRYCDNLDLMEQCGVAKIIEGSPVRWGRVHLPQFTWSSEVQKLLDVILLALVTAQVDELNRWVAEIDAGMQPGSREYLPPSIFTLRTRRGIDSVLVWPAGAGRPFEDQATNSWRSGFNVA